MRSLTAGEITILGATDKEVRAAKIEIKDAGGVYQDWFGYLLGVNWGASVDQPITELRLQLRRDNGPTLSLSPFRGDSTLNIGGSAIDAGRDIRLSPATTAYGVSPVAGDYKEVFVGKTADIDFANSAMEVLARDQGGTLVKKQIKVASEFRSVAGEPLETVMQDLLDLWAPGVTLYVPVSPGFMVTSIDWGKGSLFEALRTAAGKIGWDIRYLWDSVTSTFRLTLFEPDRTKTVPDWTFSKSRIRVTQLKINPEFIRNYIQVSYLDSADGIRKTVFATDSVSVARFGEQWMEIVEDDTSPINTTAEAQALADAALSDLAWPIAEKQVELPFFWPVELNDLIRFTANGLHMDTDIDLAVTGYEHQLGKQARTTISVRGKPAGFYRNWLKRGKEAPPAPDPGLAASVLTLTLTEPDGSYLRVALSLENTVRWVAYEKMGGWPTLNGLQTGLVDPAYKRHEDFTAALIYGHSVEPGTWYVIIVPYNSLDQEGTRKEASLVISVTATTAGVILTLTAEQITGYNELVWTTNVAVDTGGTRYVVDIYRDAALLVTNREARIDANGTNPGVAETGGYRDTVPLACVEETNCDFQSFTYTVILKDTLAVHADKTYTVILSGFWQPL